MNRATCGDIKTYMFEHKLPCMHANTQTKDAHKVCSLECELTIHRDISSDAQTQSTFLQTDAHTCHSDSHDHSLYMKKTGSCQKGRS